jgi:trigger factor
MTHEELNAVKLETLPDSEVRLTGEIPYVYLARYRAHAVEHVQHDIEMPGFRKGHIPENILISRVGEMALLEDMAHHALEDAYRELVEHLALDVIGYPKISITKLAKDNPLGFTITVAVVPEVKLPDVKKIASKLNQEKESKEVTEEEVTKQIKDILRQKVAYERLQEKARKDADKTRNDAERTSGPMPEGVAELPTPETVKRDAEAEEPEKLPLPELTDEYVKTLGKPGQFESVADFHAKLREHLAIEKDREVTSKHRAKLTDAILEKTDVVLPQVLVDAELGQMFAQMEDDLKRAQLSLEDYLTHAKKTKDDLKKEWTPSAEKRAKLQLVLNAIAKQEEVRPDSAMVNHEVAHLLEHYKDADEKRVRTYVESVLTNEAVMKMLEAA